jgi:hypothetical protein
VDAKTPIREIRQKKKIDWTKGRQITAGKKGEMEREEREREEREREEREEREERLPKINRLYTQQLVQNNCLL